MIRMMLHRINNGAGSEELLDYSERIFYAYNPIEQVTNIRHVSQPYARKCYDLAIKGKEGWDFVPVDDGRPVYAT